MDARSQKGGRGGGIVGGSFLRFLGACWSPLPCYCGALCLWSCTQWSSGGGLWWAPISARGMRAGQGCNKSTPAPVTAKAPALSRGVEEGGFPSLAASWWWRFDRQVERSLLEETHRPPDGPPSRAMPCSPCSSCSPCAFYRFRWLLLVFDAMILCSKGRCVTSFSPSRPLTGPRDRTQAQF